jgi:excisionase family DNA binding protein
MSDEPGPEPLAYSTTEAARLLGIGRTSLYGLLRSGQLRGVHLGRRLVIPRDELERLLREGDE